MNRNFNIPTLTETQKNALFAFGEETKAGTGCNLMIAAAMCEGELTRAILMTLEDLINSVGITDEELAELVSRIRVELTENILKMEEESQTSAGKKAGTLPWKEYARKKMLATFGSESCGVTIRRLCYVAEVTTDPELKEILHDLTSQIATTNVFHPERYPVLLEEARKIDELWKIKVDDLGYFTVKG